jgi:hypothetical protein
MGSQDGVDLLGVGGAVDLCLQMIEPLLLGADL